MPINVLQLTLLQRADHGLPVRAAQHHLHELHPLQAGGGLRRTQRGGGAPQQGLQLHRRQPDLRLHGGRGAESADLQKRTEAAIKEGPATAAAADR